jgi:outer membrane lipoprotein-sorting protein
MRPAAPTLLILALAVCTTTAGTPSSDAAHRRAAAEEPLAKTRAAYAALTSYADSGTAMRETDGGWDVGHFRTYRRKPSNFYFEYGRMALLYKKPVDSLPMPGKQLVFWMVNGELQTYNKEAAEHRTYPPGTSNQPEALSSAKHATMEAITLIPSLLFQKANLVGPLQEIAEISLAGDEDVGGHHCHKLVGVAQSVYPSGAVTNVRPITVWIDTQTLLIRKVFTDTPKGWGMNSISRYTYTLDPTPNPPLDDGRFRFTIPEMQQAR